MTVTDQTADADRALKGKHRRMWASGDYPALAREVISDLGPRLVAASGIGTGDRVLDVAAGSGNASVPAAATGATVLACDLAPELFDAGREAAAGAGVEIEWREADAEALPFATGEFDAAISCVGVMFAPHHEEAAAELVRVVRSGGTVAVLNWTPTGFIGQMFATMKPFAPPPPPGAQPAPRWGDTAHVRELFAGRAEIVSEQRETLRVKAFGSAEEFRDYFKSHYGPTISVYANLAADADGGAARTAELDAELADLARRHAVTGADGFAMDWEYLVLVATVAEFR